MKKMTCPQCGEGSIEPCAVAGRRTPFKNIPDLEIPASVSIPTCDACGEEWYDARTTEVLQEALQSAYQEALAAKATAAVETLKAHYTQQELERRLGLSGGYLSKIKGGKDVSSPLVALLVLLAQDPGRLQELRELLRVVPGASERVTMHVEPQRWTRRNSQPAESALSSNARVNVAAPVWKASA